MKTAKPDLTVPSDSSDIRFVAKRSENRPTKCRSFRKKAKSGARPARRIKLNRSMFNRESTAKPTFCVNRLNSKTEASAAESTTEVSVNINCVLENTSIASTTSPLPACAVDINPSPITFEGERSIVVNPSPERSGNASVSDTRTVITRKNNGLVLLPSIKLTRICKDKYKRSFSPKNKCFSHIGVISTAGQEQPREETPSQTELHAGLTVLPCISPAQKRNMSPVHVTLPMSPKTKASPFKKCKISPVQSPDSKPVIPMVDLPVPSQPPPLPSPEPPPSPLDSPPSPALSLGTLSDDDFDKEATAPVASSRVIVLSQPSYTVETSSQKQKMQPVQIHCKSSEQKEHTSNVHACLGPPQYKQTTHTPPASSFTDDALDIMSNIADDDDLFSEVKPSGPLKCSLSQDSIFNIVDEKDNPVNLRCLAEKTQANPKQSFEDHFNKPRSKSFRTPHKNSDWNCKTRNSDESIFTSAESSIKQQTKTSVRKEIEPPPIPTRVVSKTEQLRKGIFVQEKVRSICRYLEAQDIQEAWLVIKELENSKSVIDIRLLEEVVKVCEIVSVKAHTSAVPEIVVGLFKMLKCRKALKPMTFILTVLTLCRCGKFQEAFDKMSEMIDMKILPPPDILLRFFDNLHKCLETNPKWIFELISCSKRFNFTNPTHVVNNCLSSLVAAHVDVLRDVIPEQWDTLISQLCLQHNVQGAMQVQNTMEKHCIPMSDQSIKNLLNLYRDTKCIKELLDLVHLKCTKEVFDIGCIFGDKCLNLGDVELHIGDLIKTGSLPREDVLNVFIEKANSINDYSLIYNLFLKCQRVSVTLPRHILKKMVDVLENWDQNINASVEVYAALRQSKMSVKLDRKLTRPLTVLPKREPFKFQPRICNMFATKGHCSYGDRCVFSHVINEGQKFFEQNSNNFHSNGHRSDEGGQPLKTQAEFLSNSSNTMVDDHSHQQYPSLQRPLLVQPMITPIQNQVPRRITLPHRQPQPVSTRPPFQNRFQPGNPTTKFGAFQTTLNKPMAPMTQPHPGPRTTIPDKVKLNQSFSCEPPRDSKPLQQLSPLPRLHQPSPGCDTNNNNFSESQQRLERAVTSKDWSKVYLCYAESKVASNRTVEARDLRIFRNAFVKDLSIVGSNFCEFLDFVSEEKSSVKSSHSGSENNSVFDRYDIAFLGSLGVSLMEKCLVIKKFDKGYEILHTLHAHNISYFDCGKNFGCYTRDIPPSAVAIIAVKLCIGMSQKDGPLGALEVLRASNYAVPEDNITLDNMEYRIKVLKEVFNQLFDRGNMFEAYEILQHLNASSNVMVPLYVKVLNHYSSLDNFDQAFNVLAEMKENGFDLNIPLCQSLYEKFVKVCLSNGQNCKALAALNEMESRGVLLDVDIWKGIFNQGLSVASEVVTNVLFQRCVSLGVYPLTFSSDMPWLCKLGCGYSQVEVKLLIVRHLKELYLYLSQNKQCHVYPSAVEDFQIALYPRISESNVTRKFHEGIQSTISKNTLLVENVLKDLNPPLVISVKNQERFHSKFVVDPMSVYRWFTGNQRDNDAADDSSSIGSVESCVSYLTRMTEFD